MQESRERLEKQLAAMQKSGIDQTATALIAKAEQLDGAKLIVLDVGDYDQQVLRGLADRVRDGLGTGVTVLGSTHAGRPGLAVAVSKDLIARVHAGDLVKELASIIGGSGGGPANSATGGGKDAARLADALEAGAPAVRERLGGRGPLPRGRGGGGRPPRAPRRRPPRARPPPPPPRGAPPPPPPRPPRG